MAFNNLTLADELILLVMVECLEKFPSPVDIDWRSIACRLSSKHEIENMTSQEEAESGNGNPPSLLLSKGYVNVKGDDRVFQDVIYDLLRWLDDEGFVKYQPNFTVMIGADGSRMISVHANPSELTITARALNVMNSVPDSLESKETLKDRFLQYASSTGAKVADKGISELVDNLIQKFS